MITRVPSAHFASNSKNIPSNLLIAKQSVYDKIGFSFTELKAEEESADYAAHTFKLYGRWVIYREAKITPTKTGQFVTIWKRKDNEPIAPFHMSDDFDLIIISTKKDNHFGQFIFPKAILLTHGIISGNNKEGKRGIRVYPPWDVAGNSQAMKTQRWQLEYFLEMSDGKVSELVFAKTRALFKR